MIVDSKRMTPATTMDSDQSRDSSGTSPTPVPALGVAVGMCERFNAQLQAKLLDPEFHIEMQGINPTPEEWNEKCHYIRPSRGLGTLFPRSRRSPNSASASKLRPGSPEWISPKPINQKNLDGLKVLPTQFRESRQQNFLALTVC